jgi:hypothetical protein
MPVPLADVRIRIRSEFSCLGPGVGIRGPSPVPTDKDEGCRNADAGGQRFGSGYYWSVNPDSDW